MGKIMSKEDDHLTRLFPGLRGKKQGEFEKIKAKIYKEREDIVKLIKDHKLMMDSYRKIIGNNPSFIFGKGHPDLYIPFSFRFLALCNKKGRIGVALPRSAITNTGSYELRKFLIESNFELNITSLVNKKYWIFDNVESRLTIILLCINKSSESTGLKLFGPFYSKNQFKKINQISTTRFNSNEINNWNQSLSFPLLPNQKSADLLKLGKSHPFLIIVMMDGLPLLILR